MKTNTEILKSISEILKENRIKNEFVYKKSKKMFGIKHKTEFDDSSLKLALYKFVKVAPDNMKLYNDLNKELHLLPKFHIGDLVSQSSVKNGDISVVTEIKINSQNEFIYKTRLAKTSLLSKQEAFSYEDKLNYEGVSPYIEFETLGKDKNYISEIDMYRLSFLMDKNLSPLISVPEEHKITNCPDWSMLSGYSFLNYSIYLKLSKADDKNSNQYSGEIRIHHSKTLNGELRATLFLTKGGIYYGQNIDLFENRAVSRFIYSSNYKELFYRASEVFNELLTDKEKRIA